MANPRIKDLRGKDRRNFLRLVGAAGAAFAVERSKVLDYILDQGGSAMAEPLCNTTNRSVHLIGGNGGAAWFQLLWPHLIMADPANFGKGFAYHAFGMTNPVIGQNGHHDMLYGPEAPWIEGGVPKPKRYVTAMMAGQDETHTQTPVTPAVVASNASMLGTVASIQRATPCLLPVLGVQPVNLGDAPGAPAMATVPDANGMVELFNSAASQLTLLADEDKALYETYYKAILGVREASGRPTYRRHLETGKTAANLIGRNLAALLVPTAQDLTDYGVTALSQALGPNDVATTKLTNVARALATAAKAFKLGLTNCVIIAMSPGAAAEQLFTDPHDAPNNMNRVTATCTALGQMLNAFYNELALYDDPSCNGLKLADSTIMTFHGDTPHTPLQFNAWPDATPASSNWIYVMSNGHLKAGWFGRVKEDKNSTDGFDPTTGELVAGKKSVDTSTAAGAAVAYAVAKGDMAKVKEYYTGPPIDGLVNKG
jgi:hypothetical protein